MRKTLEFRQIKSFSFSRLISAYKLKFEKMKKFKNVKKNKFLKERTVLFLVISLLPTFAYAYGSDGGTIATFIGNLCNLLSGKIAQGIGVLAIICMGYRVLKGRMDWHYAAYITIGMGLILGGAYYGSTLFGGS